MTRIFKMGKQKFRIEFIMENSWNEWYQVKSFSFITIKLGSVQPRTQIFQKTKTKLRKQVNEFVIEKWLQIFWFRKSKICAWKYVISKRKCHFFTMKKQQIFRKNLENRIIFPRGEVKSSSWSYKWPSLSFLWIFLSRKYT